MVLHRVVLQWISSMVLVQLILNRGGKMAFSDIYCGQRKGWIWGRCLVFPRGSWVSGEQEEQKCELVALSEDQVLMIQTWGSESGAEWGELSSTPQLCRSSKPSAAPWKWNSFFSYEFSFCLFTLFQFLRPQFWILDVLLTFRASSSLPCFPSCLANPDFPVWGAGGRESAGQPC